MARPGSPARARSLDRDPTSFVGRRRELKELKEALSSTTLLTLTGPAGVGKTRLALRLGTDLRRAFPDGAVVATLEDVRDPALLTETVAAALGLHDGSTRWLVGALADFLAERLGIELLAERGRARDVAEQHGDGLADLTPGAHGRSLGRFALEHEPEW